MWRDLARKIICEFEGCAFRAYQDQGGVWTCGWGSTGSDIGPDTVFTQAEADARLDAHLQEVYDQVKILVKQNLSQPQIAALICFVYNVGSGNFSKSTLLACVNAGHYDDAANEFQRWDKDKGVQIPGLLRRRLAERDLFLAPDSNPCNA